MEVVPLPALEPDRGERVRAAGQRSERGAVAAANSRPFAAARRVVHRGGGDEDPHRAHLRLPLLPAPRLVGHRLRGGGGSLRVRHVRHRLAAFPACHGRRIPAGGAVSDRPAGRTSHVRADRVCGGDLDGGAVRRTSGDGPAHLRARRGDGDLDRRRGAPLHHARTARPVRGRARGRDGARGAAVLAFSRAARRGAAEIAAVRPAESTSRGGGLHRFPIVDSPVPARLLRRDAGRSDVGAGGGGIDQRVGGSAGSRDGLRCCSTASPPGDGAAARCFSSSSRR